MGAGLERIFILLYALCNSFLGTTSAYATTTANLRELGYWSHRANCGGAIYGFRLRLRESGDNEGWSLELPSLYPDNSSHDSGFRTHPSVLIILHALSRSAADIEVGA